MNESAKNVMFGLNKKKQQMNEHTCLYDLYTVLSVGNKVFLRASSVEKNV